MGSPHVSKIATPLLLSRGCPTPIAGGKSQMARWHAAGENGYTTPAISGVVGDGRPWQEPPLAPPLEEHRPWVLRSSDPGVLLMAPTLAPEELRPWLLKSTDPAPEEQIAF